MIRAVFAVFAAVSAATFACAQNASDDLVRHSIERRAVGAVIWGMPAVNAELMFQAVKDANADFNQVVYWSRPLTWKNQTLTPNPDTIYVFPFFNTKDVGPMVLEIPPASEGVDAASITGSIDDAWQVALEDVGPAGVDKGKGGKYLILPPGYKSQVPDGYIALPSQTYTGFVILRSNLKSGSDADIDKAVAYGKRIRFYPLSQAANPPETKFVDAIDVVFDSTIPYDLRFFHTLDRFVQREPWLERDKAMIDQLKTIGIEKGKPFNPDAGTQKILNDAAREAHAWLDLKYETVFTPPFNEGTHWALPALPGVVEGMMTKFANPDAYPVDGRGVAYSMAYFSAKHLGAGQYYLMTIVDKDGKPFDGGSTYRLNVPAKAPVKLYWSATVYDRATHALIRNLSWSSRSSQTPGLQKSADGSVNVYFGPKAPAGKESNWVPTSANGQFEVLFRLYGPEKPLFDKTWRLPDIERTAAVTAAQVHPHSLAGNATAVTADNFVRAESDLYFGNIVKDGGFGKFLHRREPASIDNQTVIRLNRDTLYSAAVFDLDAGPVTITLPDAGKRFMSMQVIDEDEYTSSVVYGAGSHTFARERIGTRYVLIAIRTLVDPADPKDVQQVHALQDAITVSQRGSGRFELPNWDHASQKKVRDALLALASALPDTDLMFGTREQIDPVRHLIGAASAWGGNPEKEATYLNVTPSKNDGATVYRLNVKDVPVDGFWSISVYDAEGYYQPNRYDAYSLNNITAKRGDDGSIAIQFGGCDGKIANCLPTVAGWNYMVRLYRPRAEILNGQWTFPKAEPVDSSDSRALQ
jgi:hypothetical protein